MLGPVISPGDPDSTLPGISWNVAAADRYPALILGCSVLPTSSSGWSFARSEGLLVAVRGGAHSVAGFSTCDGGVVLDLSAMAAVRVDRAAAGARAGRHDLAAVPATRRATHGLVDHGRAGFLDGIGGFTLGGRRTGRSLDRSPQRAWATPLEVLLVAERAALLAGRDDEFTMLVTIGYTGMRWGETIGLERDLLLTGLINVEWQLREVSGRFHRLPPKDDSYRSTKHEPLVPVDLPPFLAELLAAQAGKRAGQRCACAAEHGGSGRYVFLGPDGGHHRNSNYARRFFRPACDGRHPPANGRPGRLVVVDATAWPGIPVASWPPAVPGQRFAPPSGRGTPRLIGTENTGRCPSCGYAVRLRLDGRIIAHKTAADHCPGSGETPADEAPLACWLPAKDGLTPHGLRHSHKTWMVEDGIPEILAEHRLGHQVPGMRGLYAHASQQMREDLTVALQARWEQSLRERAAIDPHSPVTLLDNLLAPFRAVPRSRDRGGEDPAA